MWLKDLSFKVEGFSAVTTDKNGNKYCQMNVMKNAPRDEDDQKIGEDDHFRIFVPEKKFTQIDGLGEGDKILCSVSLRGKIIKKEDGTEFFSMDMSLGKLQKK